MRNKALLAALAATMVFSPLMARERSYSSKYQQWGEKNQRSGLFDELQKKPMTEATLLLQMDKEERKKFRNLSQQTRVDILETVNRTGTRDYEQVINKAIEEQQLRVERGQERMLHNGMNRIQ